MIDSVAKCSRELHSPKATDVWKKGVWNFQALSQTFFELRFSLGNEGKDGKNLSSQTWPGSPRRPSPRDPRPPDARNIDSLHCAVEFLLKSLLKGQLACQLTGVLKGQGLPPQLLGTNLW